MMYIALWKPIHEENSELWLLITLKKTMLLTLRIVMHSMHTTLWKFIDEENSDLCLWLLLTLKWIMCN